MSDPADFGLRQAREAIRGGRLTSRDYTAALLARVAAREAEIGAWIHLDEEAARDAAAAADRDGGEGVLQGIPVGVKDIIDTADMPTGYGSPIHAGHRPARDAAAVAAIRDAGGFPLGKTVTTEFALHHPGKTANPHAPRHTPGGSSSGSAAAVAAGMVPFAFGSQTAGSIIRPASFCGVVGYKASHGLIGLGGVQPLAQSLDTLGGFTRTIDDMHLLRAALLGTDPDPAVPDEPPRIGLCRTAQWDAADADSRTAVENAADRLAEAGAPVEDCLLPPRFAALIDAQITILGYEASRALAPDRRLAPGKLSPSLAALLADGAAVTAEAYQRAQALAAWARQALIPVFARFDVLLAPAAPGEAPAGLDSTGDPLFNRMWTLLHGPALCLPGARGRNGLPVGIQLVGPVGGDAALLAAGAWIESRLAPG